MENNELETESEFHEIRNTRALARVTNVPWAICEDNYWDIINISSRTNLNLQYAVELHEAKKKARFEAISGESLKGTRNVVVTTDGVAIVPVFDSLFRRADSFESISGAMSMEMIESDFIKAIESKKVNSILLDIDSPGGEVNYTEELANTIFMAREYGKRIESFSSGTWASAAVWIGSAATHRSATKTAFVGSVGVLSSYVSTTQRDKANGIRRIKVVDSNAPNKAIDPDTTEGEKQIKAMVDDLAFVFRSTVARNLAISEEKVKSWKGSIFVGQKAMDAGLVERIVYRDQVMRDLSNAEAQPKQFKAAAVDKTTAEQETPFLAIDQAPSDDLSNTTTDADAEASGEQVETISGEFDTIIPESKELNTLANENENNDEKKSAWQTFGVAMGFMPKEGTPQSHVKSDREIKLEARDRTTFLANVKPKVVPAAHDAVSELYEAAQKFGIEDKVTDFFAKMPDHKILGEDTIEPKAGLKTAIEANADDEEDPDIKEAREVAAQYAKESNPQ